jgi:predicted neuraminidase
VFDADFVYPVVPGLPFAHAPSLVETPCGGLVLAWYAYPRVEYEEARIVVARRPADRADWEDQSLLFPHLRSSLGNPVLFFDPDGRLHLLFALLRGAYWTDAVLHGATSDDAGRTWSEPRQIRPERGLMIRHAPLAVAGADLLLPAYDEAGCEPVLLRSCRPFERWEVAARVPGVALIQPAVVREGPSRLVMVLRPADARRVVWRSISCDDGASWSTPRPTSLPSAPSGIAAFRWNGDIAVVHNPSGGQQRHPLSLALSRDGGEHWSALRHLDTASFELSYPSFLVSRDGVVHGAYSYNRRFIKYVTLDRAWWREADR